MPDEFCPCGVPYDEVENPPVKTDIGDLCADCAYAFEQEQRNHEMQRDNALD